MSSYRVAVTPSSRSPLEIDQREVSAEDLDSLLAHTIGAKDGPALIPAIFAPCPSICSGEARGKLSCGGEKLHRLSSNVTHATMLGLDIDDVSVEKLTEIRQKMQKSGLLHWIWSTFSHNPPQNCRIRILVPFDAPLLVQSPEWWSETAWPRLVDVLGFTDVAGTDTSCRDAARLYYLPRRPENQTAFFSVKVPGLVFSPTQYFRHVQSVRVETAPPAPKASSTPQEPVDLDAIRARLKTVQHERARPLIARVLKGEAPTPSPKNRTQGEPSRYEAWRCVTSTLSLVVDGGESVEALLSLLHPSWASEVNECPEDHTRWHTISDLLEAALASAPAYKEAKAVKRAEEQARMEAALARSSLRPTPAPQEDASAIVISGEADDWTRLLKWRPGKEHDTLLQCADNVSLVLHRHPDWRGTLKRNLLTGNIEIHGGPLIGRGDKKGRELRDGDVSECADWLARVSDLRIGDAVIYARMAMIADRHAYDPLVTYLGGLSWDGTPRITDAMRALFSAEAQGEYLSTVSRKFFVGAVARALRPGCQLDTVVVLEGAQGIGKSSAVKVLGGDWSTDSPIDVRGDKDSLMVLQGMWFVELSELDALRKSEITAQRSFISKREDKFRAPYERVSRVMPRRCVFFGTTNSDDYLQDEAGNRRYWPIRCTGALDLEGLARDRDQLFAEAVVAFRAGETWYLDASEGALAKIETQARMGADSIADAIVAWLAELKPEARPTELGTHEVCVSVLNESPARGLETRIGKALKRLGFESLGRQGDTRKRSYATPTALLEMPRTGSRLSVNDRMHAARISGVVQCTPEKKQDK